MVSVGRGGFLLFQVYPFMFLEIVMHILVTKLFLMAELLLEVILEAAH